MLWADDFVSDPVGMGELRATPRRKTAQLTMIPRLWNSTAVMRLADEVTIAQLRNVVPIDTICALWTTLVTTIRRRILSRLPTPTITAPAIGHRSRHMASPDSESRAIRQITMDVQRRMQVA